MDQCDLDSLRVGQLRIWKIGPPDLILLVQRDDDVWLFTQSDGLFTHLDGRMNTAHSDYLLRHTQLVSEVDNNS